MPEVIDKKFDTDDGHDHVVSEWLPKTKFSKYRTCVMPGCKYVETKRVD